jgi:hypothetical protein
MLCLPAPPTVGATSPTCINYGHTNHFTQECTAPRKNAAQGHVNHPPRGPQKVATTKTGRVNYNTMEDVLEGEQLLAGTFSLQGHPIIILFNSGATHNLISKACIQKCQLAIMHVSTPYMISTWGGDCHQPSS